MKKQIIRILTLVLFVCFGMAVLSACDLALTLPDDPKVQTYTVSYAAGGGTGTAPAAEQFKAGEKFTVKTNPFTYEGHEFKIWNDGEKDVAAGSEYTMPAKDVTFTAKWEEKSAPAPAQQVTVTYSLGDYAEGTAPAPAKIEKGGSVTLPAAPARDGYTFKGWKVGTDDALKQAGDKITVDADVTAVAQWEKNTPPAKEQVTVTFSLGEYEDGTVPAPVKTNKGEEYVLPDAPVWEGHLFTGWKLGEDVKKAGEKITPNADVTLTAQYKAVSYTIAGAEVSADDKGAYVSVSGTFTGYTKDEFKALLEDDDHDELAFHIINGGPQDWSHIDLPVTIEVTDEGFTVKFTVTSLEIKPGVPYHVCENYTGAGDIKAVTYDDHVDFGGKRYALLGLAGNSLVLTVSETPKGSYQITTAEISADDAHVYVTVSGTFTGYTKEEFEALLKDDNHDEIAFRVFRFGGPDGMDWSTQDVTTVYTVTEGTYSVKFDITNLGMETFGIGKDWSAYGDIKTTNVNTTVTLGTKSYTLVGNTGNLTFKIEAKSDPDVPQKSYVILGATLDVEKDGKVYLILNGTCTGYTTEQLQDLYKDFGLYNDGWANVTPVVTVTEGTFTIKIDITDLDNKDYAVCVDKGGSGDIILKADYEIEKISGDKVYKLYPDWETKMHLTVKENSTIAFTSIDITVDPEAQKVYLIINGTSNGYSEEKLKAYLEGDIDGHKFFSFWGNTVQRENPASIVATVEGNNWTAKCDVTDLKFESLRNISCPDDTKAASFSEGVKDKSVVLGSKKYTLQEKNGSGWDNVGLKVEFNGVEIGSEKHDNAFDSNPAYTDSVKKGEVLSFKGKLTSLATENYFAPTIFLYSAGSTPAISFRMDWWINGLNTSGGDPTTMDCTQEGWTVTKHEGPVWETYLETIKDAEIVLTVNWSNENIIYVSFLAKGIQSKFTERMVYIVTASKGNTLKDSYAVGFGTEHSHLVLDERSVGKAGYRLYDELQAGTQLDLGSADNKTYYHYLFNNYIEKGDKIVLEGMSTAVLANNWDANGLYIGTNIGTETWFRADNYIDGTTYTDENPVHDVTAEKWHIEKNNGGWTDWAKYKEILTSCSYKLTIDWTGDSIVITMEFTKAEVGTYTQTYTITALEGSTLSGQYNFGLGCCNSSATLKATEVTRA